MKKEKILELAKKFHRWTNYEKDVIGYTEKGVAITKQHKVWTFTEDDLINFSKFILKEGK